MSWEERKVIKVLFGRDELGREEEIVLSGKMSRGGRRDKKLVEYIKFKI